MQNYLKYIINVGSSEKLSLSQNKQIRLLNIINLFISGLVLAAGIFLFYLAKPESELFILFVGISLSGILLFSVYLNYINQSNLAKYISMITFSFITLVICLIYGDNAKALYLFFIAATLPFVFFSDSKVIFSIWLMNLLFLIFVIWFNSEFTPFFHRDDTYLLYNYFTPVLAFIMLGATVQTFKRENYMNEQKLQKQNEIINEQTEELKQQSEFKSKLFANISHEFKTPLTLISAPIRHLTKTETDPKILKTYELVLSNCDQLLNLINQMLELSKLDSGMLKIKQEVTDLFALIKSCMAVFEFQAESQNIRFDFTSDVMYLPIFADTEYMRIIILNLLSNAFKYTENGGKIEISLKTDDQDFIYFSVEDTGIGIPTNRLKDIFNRFYYIETDENINLSATGIGLELTKELVELHNGSISVKSVYGKGSCFTVKIPLVKHNEITETKAYADNYLEADVDSLHEAFTFDNMRIIPEQSESKEKKLILITEDHPEMLIFLKELLEKSYRIMLAKNGKIAFEKALESIPDLIITDVMMNESDGFEFCKKIRQEQKTGHIPLVMLTAKAFDSDKQEGILSGADQYLTKPFNPDELLLLISNLLNRQEQFKAYYSKKIFSTSEEFEIQSKDELFLNKLIKRIEENIENSDYTIEYLSKDMNYSRSQLYRKVIALTNASPNEFIRNIRLKHAALLLKNKSANISEISYLVGFTSPSYFTECFKKLYGLTPSGFINKQS